MSDAAQKVEARMHRLENMISFGKTCGFRTIRYGDTSPEGMAEKAAYVHDVMEYRMNLFELDWSATTATKTTTKHHSGRNPHQTRRRRPRKEPPPSSFRWQCGTTGFRPLRATKPVGNV